MIGENIKRLREEKGLTQAQLAEMLPCSQVLIVLWERGDRNVTSTYIPHLCRALDCDPNELYGMEDLHDGSENG